MPNLLLAAAALEIAPESGARLAAALVAAVLAPVVLVVVVIALMLAPLFPPPPGASLGEGAAMPGRVAPSALPPVPTAHLAVMVEVGEASGIPWSLLAAIASVESGFGANMSTSWAGAIGYGQFMPPSWAAFGEGGDPYDYRDVIPAMARYLLAAGAPADLPAAVYAYNHDWDYVALVLGRMAVYATLGPRPAEASAAPAGAER